MKHVALCLIVFLAFCACEQNPGVQNQEFDTGVLSIQMDAEKIPNEVAKLSGSLTREDFDPIEFDFEVNENSASILIENIAEGVWTIKIDAFNINGMIIYTASKEVLVVANQVTPVHIHLMKTGSVQIIVTWPDDPGNGSEDLVNIPDKAFLSALIELGVDTDGDGKISYGEAEAVNSLVIGSSNLPEDTLGMIVGCSGYSSSISDITGIEAFINLETFICPCAQIIEMDFSNNTELQYIDCACNSITSLDVTKNAELKTLNCINNQLASLDLSHNVALRYLQCRENQIIDLELTANKNLGLLDCAYNQLKSLDVSNNTLLFHLEPHHNQLTELDVSNNPLLIWLEPHNNRITELDVSNNPLLEWLACMNNKLTELDVKSNPELREFHCGGNRLITLDISNNRKIGTKYDWYPDLDIANMPTLTEVCVWALPFPPVGIEVDTGGSPNVYFTTDCSQ